MSTALSPLAPKTYPELPPIGGVRLATAEAGIRYEGRTDVLYAAFDRGAAVAGVFTQSKCPSAPVDWCRAESRRRRGPGAGGQFRQRQRLHRHEGCASRAAHGRARRESRGMPAEQVFLASTGVIGEPLDASEVRGRARRLRAPRRGLRLGARPRQAIMTTDTFPKLATRTADLGGVDGHDQRHRQGRRHDRARYGDHARLRLHRRARSWPRPCSRSSSAPPTGASTASPSTATPRPPTRCSCSPPARRASAARRSSRIRRIRGLQGLRRGARRSPRRSRPAGRARRRGRAQVRDRRGGGRDERQIGAAHRPFDRELAPGEDGDRRRGRQLGARRHGGRQGRRAGRPRQACDLLRRHPRRGRRRARPGLRRGRRPPPT